MKKMIFALAFGLVTSTALAQKSTLKEAPPQEAPYTDSEQTEEDADLSSVEETAPTPTEAESEEEVSSEEEPTSEAPAKIAETEKPLEKPADQPNPYSEGEYRDKKDRFGRPDPRNRTLSKENDMLVRQGLLKISKTGEFVYTYPESPQRNSLSIRAGTFSPPNLVNPGTGTTFQQIYGTEAKMMFVFEYEWQLLKLPIGKLGLVVGTGLYTATGNGFYRTPALQPFPKAEEIYSFYMMPNQVSAVYRMQFFDRQIIVPYGSAGADYFSIVETRDDGGSTKLGGGAGFHVGVGGSLQLDFLSKQSMFDMDQEFGINHIYLTFDYKYIQGVASTFNITQNLMTGGITAEF